LKNLLSAPDFPVVSGVRRRWPVASEEPRIGAKDTMDRLESAVKRKGSTSSRASPRGRGGEARQEAARHPSLLIFGDPQGGTPFMECAQTVGIDLPLKALVWQDEVRAGLALATTTLRTLAAQPRAWRSARQRRPERSLPAREEAVAR